MLHRLASAPTEYDFLSNTLERTFPLGFDIELWTRDCLSRVERSVDQLELHEREVNRANMIPYIHQNHRI